MSEIILSKQEIENLPPVIGVHRHWAYVYSEGPHPWTHYYKAISCEEYEELSLKVCDLKEEMGTG